MNLTRPQVESILVENGLEPTAPDEEIRSALIRANWREQDVEMALVILRENVVTHETHVDAVRNLFYKDKRLGAQEINNLLGIEVDLPPDTLGTYTDQDSGSVLRSQVLEILIVSIFLSAIFILGGMFIFKVGIFHQTVI